MVSLFRHASADEYKVNTKPLISNKESDRDIIEFNLWRESRPNSISGARGESGATKACISILISGVRFKIRKVYCEIVSFAPLAHT